MKKKSKILLIVLAGLAVVVMIVLNVVISNKDMTSVNAEKVNVLDLTEEVSASGYIQPMSKVNIVAQVSAEIIIIPIKEGQAVTKGQLLVLLDTVQLYKDLEQSLFSLNEIEARTEASRTLFLQSEEVCERKRELYVRKLISEEVVDDAEYSCQNYKFILEAMVNSTKQAKSRYEKALDNLDRTRLVAPMDGVVTYLDAEVGEIAAAQTPYSQGRTLMTISNLSTFEVEVDVDETEIIKIALGQQAKIEIDAFTDTTFNGEVLEIGNTAVVSARSSNEQATNFKVKILFKDENPDIRPGMSATVDIITNSKKDVLTVPYGAIVMRELDADSLAEAAENNPGQNDVDNPGEEELAVINDENEDEVNESESNENNNVEEETSSEKDESVDNKKKNLKEYKGVFIVKDNKARFICVKTGIADQKNIEILAGLTENDTVITGPYRTLRKIKHEEDIEISKSE